MSVKEAPKGGGKNVESSEADRRSSPRYALTAIAELMDRRSGARMAVRISDVSRDGCYADALNVFPSRTKVIVSIRHAEVEFKAMATVVYALPTLGMGIHFENVAPEMRPIMEKWIAAIHGEFSMDSTPTDGHAHTPKSTERKVLYRLVELLMRKGLVSQTEGIDLLEQLLREH
jgi:hypothetical protein